MIKHTRNFLLGFCILCATLKAANAEDMVIEQVNKNIVLVYSSAAECTQVLAPGPEQYVQLIKTYFANLYPNGVGYWILPPVNEYQTDRGICVINLESSLQRYQRSLYDFHLTYPSRLQPPMLLAYQWRDKAGNIMRSAIPQQLPLPQDPTSIPQSAKGAATEKRF